MLQCIAFSLSFSKYVSLSEKKRPCGRLMSYKFHKPCFVLAIMQVQQFIYAFASILHFILLWTVPLPNLGFSLEGFTSFHLFRFQKSYVTVALLKIFAMGYPLGIDSAVHLAAPQPY